MSFNIINLKKNSKNKRYYEFTSSKRTGTDYVKDFL